MKLEELYSREHKRIAGDKHELSDFRADVLRWALFEIPERVATGVTAMPCKDDAPSIIGEWRNGDKKRWIIALEEGSHALNWASIAMRAANLHRDNADTSILAVRTSGQTPIPRPEWGSVATEIDEVQISGALSIVTLDSDLLARIYAAWELYTQACQGDITYEPDDVVRFAARRFQGWYDALRSGKFGKGGAEGAPESGEVLEPLLGPPPELSSCPAATASSTAPAHASSPAPMAAPAPAPEKAAAHMPAAEAPCSTQMEPVPADAAAPSIVQESAPDSSTGETSSAKPASFPVLLPAPAPLPPSPPPSVTSAVSVVSPANVLRPRPHVQTPKFTKAS
jgi:hypothetical protein